MPRLLIQEGTCEADGDALQISASVDGLRVYFRLAGDAPFSGLTGDPFLAPAIVRAMQRRVPIEVAPGLPVSARLLRGAKEYQEIFGQWYRDLQQVPMVAAETRQAAPPTGTVGMFFSGGVDGHYSLLRNKDRVTHLILCLGLDIPPTESERWERTRSSIEKIAARHDKRICLVESNVKPLLETKLYDNQGAILISTALGLDFDRLLVPATHDYLSVHRYGTHPLTDAALSTGRTKVEHDGMALRSTKIRRLIDAGVDLSELRVCNRHTDFNCGCCEKCLRTMTALEVLGVEVASLPRLTDVTVLRGVKLWEQGFSDYWEDNLHLALEYGREDIAREIRKTLHKFQRREALRILDKAWLGGSVARWRRRHRGET
jgi:hypothetical protein